MIFMAKIIGSIMLIFSCLMIGFRVKKKKINRIDDLRNLVLCINILENEIRYSLNDIKKSFLKICSESSGTNQKIFSDVCYHLENSEGTPLSLIWKRVVNENSQNSFYTYKDINIILDFGTVLGAGNAETQLKNIDSFKSNLSNNLDDANRQMSKNGDLSLKLSIYAGVLLVIFLL